jgi:hypothetical protein
LLLSIAVDSRADAVRPKVVGPARQSIEGTLIIEWADPHPDLSTAGGTRYLLALDDGTLKELQLDGHEASALLNFGRRVAVVTSSAANSAAIAVDSIVASSNESAASTPGGNGPTKRVIYLLLKFPDDADVPHPPEFYTNLNNPDVPPVGEVFPSTINGFFKKTSWNQFSWIGDVGGVGGVGAPGGWLTLPHPKSYYAPCGWEASCAQTPVLTSDSMDVGRAAGIDFSVYDNVNFVFSNDLDCCARGGGFYGAPEGKFFGATWEPPWGQEAHIYSHEMGHSLGLPHSGWVYYAYDNPWDVMSRRSLAANVLCGSYLSANNGGTPRDLYCAEPGNGYIGPHKDYLGWIPAQNEVVTDTSSSVTVTLEGLALPLSNVPKLLKICIDGVSCSGSDAHYFTAEARVKDLSAASQFDNGLVGEGVIIHEVRMDQPPVDGPCYYNNQSGFAFPVDSTPGDYDSNFCSFAAYSYPNYALFNAQWNPGQGYSNSGFGINVVSRSGSTFVVSTTGAQPPTVTNVTPSTGRTIGGTNITISGTNFVSGMSVVIDGWPASEVTVVNATTITARTPPHGAGSVGVAVINPLGQTAVRADGFLYKDPVPFTDTPLLAGMVIKRVHVMELRARIDALRSKYGVVPAAFDYADPTITPGVTFMKAQHIVELRQALAPAFLAATGTSPTYATDPSLAAGALIKKGHITELRSLVQAIE